MSTEDMEEYKGKKPTNKNSPKRMVGISVAIIAIIAIIAIGVVSLIRKKPNQEIIHREPEFAQIAEICEMATLKCYYHNVAEYKRDPDAIFQYGWFQYGYKKIWLEYSGIVTVGVDASKIRVEKPDSNGVVDIFIPEAKVFDVSADKESIADPICDTGYFTEITVEEKAKAFSEAQKNMREAAEADNTILTEARNNAKELIKQYVERIEDPSSNLKYTVNWIDENNEG